MQAYRELTDIGLAGTAIKTALGVGTPTLALSPEQ